MPDAEELQRRLSNAPRNPTREAFLSFFIREYAGQLMSGADVVENLSDAIFAHAGDSELYDALTGCMEQFIDILVSDASVRRDADVFLKREKKRAKDFRDNKF